MEGLNLPLMAIIDYRGFRLLAESIMPISKSTLVYGTHDAGRSMRNSCPQIAQYFQRVGTGEKHNWQHNLCTHAS